LERQAARTILEAIEAAPSVSSAADRDALDEQPVASVNVFGREGDYWTVIFDGSTVRVRDLKGMHYLARLFADPGREYHVLDLVAAETSRVAQVDNSRAGRLHDRRECLLGAQGLREVDSDTGVSGGDKAVHGRVITVTRSAR
jgi:hypothetical protein